MPKYSKPEFAKLCGIKPNVLSIYIAREKVIVTDGVIDGSDYKNAAFLQKRSGKDAPLTLTKQSSPFLPESPALPQVNAKPDKFTDISYAFLEKEKLRMQVEELEKKNRKMDQMHEKAQGESIPTAQATLLIMQLSEAINGSWENEFEDVLNKISHKHQLSRLEIADLKKMKAIVANTAREKAVKEAMKMLRRIQVEYAEKKGVGEHG